MCPGSKHKWELLSEMVIQNETAMWYFTEQQDCCFPNCRPHISRHFFKRMNLRNEGCSSSDLQLRL
jgi:hypothetical protein